jgi:hypothetical protein
MPTLGPLEWISAVECAATEPDPDDETTYPYSKTVSVGFFIPSGWPAVCNCNINVTSGPGSTYLWGVIVGNLGTRLPYWHGFASGTGYPGLPNCYSGSCFTERDSAGGGTSGRRGCTDFSSAPSDSTWTMYYYDA